MNYTILSYNNILRYSNVDSIKLSHNNREYNIYYAVASNIIIEVENFGLKFEVINSELHLSCANNNYEPHARIIANYDISYLIESQILKLELLLPYLDEIIAIYENAKQQSYMLFKRGKQTKRAN